MVNRGEWRAHLLERLDHQIAASAAAGLFALREELAGYGDGAAGDHGSAANGIAVPLILDTPMGQIRFVSPVTTLGTPAHIPLSELALEAIFPSTAENASFFQHAA